MRVDGERERGGGEIEQPIFLGDFLLARRSKQPLGRNRKRRRRYLFYNNNDTLRAKHTGRAQPQDECSLMPPRETANDSHTGD